MPMTGPWFGVVLGRGIGCFLAMPLAMQSPVAFLGLKLRMFNKFEDTAGNDLTYYVVVF